MVTEQQTGVDDAAMPVHMPRERPETERDHQGGRVMKERFMALLHRLNIIHGPYQKRGYLIWRCVNCGKYANADPYEAYAPYDWRQSKEAD